MICDICIIYKNALYTWEIYLIFYKYKCNIIFKIYESLCGTLETYNIVHQLFLNRKFHDVQYLKIAKGIDPESSFHKKKNSKTMITDVNLTYCGDHFAIYTNTELLCCTPGTNIMCMPLMF